MMTFYKEFVKNISFPILSKRSGHSGLYRYLAELEKSQYLEPQTIRRLQLSRLKKLLCHAYANCDFYKKRFDQAGFNPMSFNDFSELKQIPSLSKNEIRENLNNLVAKNYKSSELHSSETGGTTGVKMKFFRDNACLSPKEAALYRFEKWTGWDFGERIGLVWPAQQDYVGYWTLKSKIKNELSLRQIVCPAAIITEELVSNYVNQLINKKPTMIRGFTTPLYEVAKYIQDNRIENLKPKGIITTGEPLYSHQRKIISEAFNCDVFDSYRSREAGPLAQECEFHSGMHINAESLYIEAVSLDGKLSPAESAGEILVTDLLNYGMPLIRYRMGDMAVLSDVICKCGRGLPLMKNIEGRTSDVFYTPDKKRIAAITLVLYLVDEAPGLLGQVQIIQDKLNHLIIRMTADPPPSDHLKSYQRQKVKELFGPKMEISFDVVASIPREASGKYLFTKCLIDEAGQIK
jgi:phenylacetate-CoA ligase